MNERGRLPCRVAVFSQKRARSMSSIAAWLVTMAMPLSASAGLGDAATSIAGDGATMGAATLTSVARPSYVRHEITTGDGVRVREFAAPGGTVFAVAFDGPAMPDLKTVLGTRYDSYVASARSRRGSHHVVSFVADGAVVTVMKLPRGFSGSARIPAATPAGVDPQDLR